MSNTNIWADISDGIAMVSNAIRGVTNAFANPQPPLGMNPGFDVNMSRRDLPMYQNPVYSTPQYYAPPSGFINMAPPVQSMPVAYPYIPGMTDPRYGMSGAYPPSSYSMNVNGINPYCQLPTYTSPFPNNVVYGYPGGNNYGY